MATTREAKLEKVREGDRVGQWKLTHWAADDSGNAWDICTIWFDDAVMRKLTEQYDTELDRGVPFDGPVIAPGTPIEDEELVEIEAEVGTFQTINGAEFELRAKALNAAAMSCTRGVSGGAVTDRAKDYESYLRGE